MSVANQIEQAIREAKAKAATKWLKRSYPKFEFTKVDDLGNVWRGDNSIVGQVSITFNDSFTLKIHGEVQN